MVTIMYELYLLDQNNVNGRTFLLNNVVFLYCIFNMTNTVSSYMHASISIDVQQHNQKHVIQ